MTYAELLAHLTSLHRYAADPLDPAGTHWTWHADKHEERDWPHRHQPDPDEKYGHTGAPVPARRG